MIRVLCRSSLTLCLMLTLFVFPSAAQEEEVVEKAKGMAMDKAKDTMLDKAAEVAEPKKQMPADTAVASLGECPEAVATWRDNELVEGGSREGFLEAVRDHRAWLVNKGYEKVRIRTWSAFEPMAGDASNQGPSNQLVGFGSEVVYPSFDYASEIWSKRESDRDEDYEAFVAKYRANTVIKTTRMLCLSE